MSDDLIRRPLPILMSHFPSAPAVDFNDIDQRVWLRCSCGVDFRDRDHRRVMENWALHAMQHMETCADTIARLQAELAEARRETRENVEAIRREARNEALREISRLKALIRLAYGEGAIDVVSRGLNSRNFDDLFETSDSKTAMDDPDYHCVEFPDNFAMIEDKL